MLSFVKFHMLVWNLFSDSFRKKYWAHCLVLGCLLVVLISVYVMYFIFTL